MARIETWLDCDLKKIIRVHEIKGNVFTQDHLGNLIGVRVYDDGEPVTLAGSVNGYCILADGSTVPVDGDRDTSGNRAWIILPQSAYAVPGTIRITIKLTETDGDDVDHIVTLASLVGTVTRSKTDNMVTPSSQVITDWSQQISAEMQEVSDAAAAAAGNFAAAYSTTKTYSVGEYVTYNGALYRCTTAVTTAGSWSSNSAKFAAVKMGNDVADLKSAFDTFNEGTFTTGENLFNYKTVTLGYLLKNDGSFKSNSSGFISDYIAVEPDTTYNMRSIPKSDTYANVCFYDASKTYINYYGGSSSNKYFTTPSTCAYIRITGNVSILETQMVNKGNSFTEFVPFGEVLLPTSGGADYCYLLCIKPLCYDADTKRIFAVTDASVLINLHIPGKNLIQFSNPIQVTGDSGELLCYDISDNTFKLKDKDAYLAKTLYRVGNIEQKQINANFDAPRNQVFIVGQSKPVLTFDMIQRTVDVNIGNGTYLWYQKSYYALTAGSYTLTYGDQPNHLMVMFNLYTREFIATNSYSEYDSDMQVIPIAELYGKSIQCVIPYDVKSITAKLFAKKIVTYGDSLTWYDGNAFTWGEYQGETCYGYQSYLTKYLGASITNRGQSGKTTPQIATRIMSDSTNISESDYVIFMPSIMNDDRSNHDSEMDSVLPGTVQPICGTFDTTTTAGAMQAAIEYIYSIKPEVRIVIMVEPMGFTYYSGKGNLCDDNFAIVIRNVAKLYGIPIIDLWYNSGVNELTRNTYYADPPFGDNNHKYMYHPNNYGWERISKVICEEMTKY